ncbi:MAG: CPBP family intramembrane metalloprotease [Clostridia bacterium]|nr:CPBP family intramembrane metalloprotease [Clostridia bacterium]
MKKTGRAVGKAALAVVIFVYLQAQVSAVYGVITALTNPVHSADEALSLVLSNDTLSWVSLISGVLAALTLWLVWWLQGSNLWAQANVRRIRPTGVVFSATMGVGVCLLVTVAMGLIPWPASWMETYTEMAGEISGGWSVISALATVVVAPVVEELVFRGIAYTSLKSVMPRWLAAVLVSATFGLLHGTAIWFSYTFVLGFVMIFVYEQTKSLWGSIALHAAFNIVGQLPLMAEEPSFVSIVLVAGGGVALTAVSGILLRATQEQTD